jgi:hypothetical protein
MKLEYPAPLKCKADAMQTYNDAFVLYSEGAQLKYRQEFRNVDFGF